MLGREAERERSRAVLAAARSGRAGALVVRGQTGCGRTTFLDAVVADAEAAAMAVVRIVGREVEHGLTWSGLHDLVRPLRAYVPQLAPHQRSVLEGALALGPPVTSERFAVAVAALHLLAVAGDDAPLAVVVDDLQWVDAPSREVLTFVARRLDAEGVALVVSVTGADDDLAGIEAIELGPLDHGAVASLLAGRTGNAVAPDVAETVARATGGNPLALVELARTLRAEQLLGTAPLPDPLPVGSAASSLIGEELAALPAPTRRALGVVALMRGCSHDDVAAALEVAGLAPSDLDAAEAIGLIDRGGDRVDFRSALARAAVHAAATPADQRAAHEAVVAVVDAEREPERYARHLAASTIGPSAAVASALASAAARAFDRGAFGSAADLWADAAERSPAGDVELLVRAGEAAMAAGAPVRALAILERAVATVSPQAPVLRARAVHLRALARDDTAQPGAVDELHREGLLVADIDPELAVTMLADAVSIAAIGARAETAFEVSEDIVRIARDASQHIEALASIARGVAHVAVGEAGAPARLEGWQHVLSHVDDPSAWRVLRALGMVLIFAERFDEANALLDVLIAKAREERAASLLAPTLLTSGILAFSTGDWRRMEDDVTEAVSLAAAIGQRTVQLQALANLALFEVQLGRATALGRIDDVVRLTSGRLPPVLRQVVAATRAGEAMLHGRADVAVAQLVELDGGGRSSPAPMLWEADLVEAHIAVGDRSAALDTLDRFEERARAIAHRRSIARAEVLRAVLSDDVDAGEARVERAVTLLRAPAIPFVEARVRHVWGEELLRRGHVAEGRAHLDAAQAIFERLGAGAWLDRSRSLLGEPDAAGTSDDDLTPEERRVLTAVGRGESVAAAASAMLLSPSTVERHLASAMAKLGMHGRDELVDLEDRAAPAVVSVPTVIRLFGTLRVSRGDVDLTPPPGMASKVVKVVALAEGMLHVDELVEVLWKDAEPGRGRARLRNVIARVRAASGDIIVRRGELLAVARDVEVDVVRFRKEAARALALGPVPAAVAPAELALALATDDLLLDAVYEPWATVPRERLRNDRLALLDLLADVAAAAGDVDRAARVIDDALALEPYDEHRYVRLARLLFAAGRRTAAASVVRRAERSMGELGVGPSPALAEIASALRRP